MNKPNVAKFIKKTKIKVLKRSPEILTGVGIAGMITTTVLAVKATPKALDLIEKRKYELETDKLPKKEVIKQCWKVYIPAAVTGTASIICLVGASSVHIRRNAALTAAYKLSETALHDYQEKVIETIGEKKEQAVRDAVDKKRVEDNPVSNNEVIVTAKGNTLCLDYYTGRYFESDIEQFKRAINKINSVMLCDDYVSLNDLYDELGLDRVALGDEMGWNVNRVNRRELIQPRTSAQIADDGRPCIVVACDPAPQHGYYEY